MYAVWRTIRPAAFPTEKKIKNLRLWKFVGLNESTGNDR